MTSTSLIDRPVRVTSRVSRLPLRSVAIPLLCFLVTMLTTTAVGMRYMHNFRQGHAPFANDIDLLPFEWIVHHLRDLASGLPFSLTLVAILLAHEFGHYFACRRYGIRSTLPYLIPAPSLSGTFGAVIRLQSVIRSRSALMVIGAAGPVAGFAVALATIFLGLGWSRYGSSATSVGVATPLAIRAVHHLLRQPSLALVIPHPVLSASWIGLLITSLNLIPAGQLDGGHILYALSPRVHRWCSRLVVAALFALGLFSWAGWLVWAFILLLPGMRHPRVIDPLDLPRGHRALAALSAAILIAAGSLQPFQGYSLLQCLGLLTGPS